MEQVKDIAVQGIAPWMLWVALFVGVALCAVIAAVYKVVQIRREETRHRDEHIAQIAEGVINQQVETLAEDISRKVTDAMQDKFDAIDRKLDSDKTRIEAQERRSGEHDRTLDRIEKTLESVDANIKDIHEGFTYLAQGTIATLNHQRHNGNPEELDEAAKELEKYLTHRPIVPMQQEAK